MNCLEAADSAPRAAPALRLLPAEAIDAPSPLKAALDAKFWPAEMLSQPVTRLRTRRGPIVFVSDPAIADRLLRAPLTQIRRERTYRRVFGAASGDDAVTVAEGAVWKSVRSWLSPVFRGASLGDAEPVLREDVERALGGWRGQHVDDLHLEMTALSLLLVWRLVLAERDAEAPDKEIRRAAEHCVAGCRERRLGAAVEAVRGFADAVVDRPPSHPLLPGNPFAAERAGERSRQARHTQALALLNAAHETTAAALTWMVISVGRDSALQTALSGGSAEPDMPAARLGEAVRCETLRLFPSPPILLREAAGDVQVEGLHLARGEAVAINLYAMHRRPDLWRDADAFDPDRWIGTDRHTGFLPFGGGVHGCAGRAFALCQMRLVLDVLCERYEVQMEREPAHLGALLTLHPEAPVALRYWPRITGHG